MKVPNLSNFHHSSQQQVPPHPRDPGRERQGRGTGFVSSPKARIPRQCWAVSAEDTKISSPSGQKHKMHLPR
ncbi:Hypothetical predicted protein [Podarcis lilfordi]|uniref:Uncharacterized protein n=1 Tax=Podarcis lilfordi TaxID=74358 RepID=A0AA35P4D4_9SAUR|nr:Hypothetical predicted protein [Podarcis lilfordi]